VIAALTGLGLWRLSSYLHSLGDQENCVVVSASERVIHQILVKEIFVILWMHSHRKRVSLLGVLLVSVGLLTGTQAKGKRRRPGSVNRRREEEIRQRKSVFGSGLPAPDRLTGYMGARAIASL